MRWIGGLLAVVGSVTTIYLLYVGITVAIVLSALSRNEEFGMSDFAVTSASGQALSPQVAVGYGLLILGVSVCSLIVGLKLLSPSRQESAPTSKSERQVSKGD